jgi:hypothetical protein
MAEKENRCWPGYEPVKGKPQHSQGSCKPKADSKTTPAQKKVKANRKKQLDHWEAEHPGARRSAAQHMKGPKGSGDKPASRTKKASGSTTTKKSATKRKTTAKRAKSTQTTQRRTTKRSS